MKKILHIVLLLAALGSLATVNTGCTAKMKKAYHESRADKYFAAGNYDAAEVEYMNVLHNDDQDAKAFSRLGAMYLDEGRMQRAVAFLDRASKLATNDLAVRVKLGYAQAATGQMQAAREQATFVLAHDPHSVDAPLILVQTVQSPKEAAAVKAQLEQCIKAGDTAALQVALGRLAYQQGETNASLAAIQRALALDPKSADALEYMGAYYMTQHDFKNAESNLKAATDLSPLRSSRRLLYARFKVQKGDVAGARQDLEKLVQQAPDYNPAVMALAEIALNDKQYDVCRTQLDKVLAREPEYFDALVLDSRLRSAQGDMAGAIATLERMAKIYTRVPIVQYQLGAAYYASGDELKATASLNRALELETNMVGASILLAQIQIKNQNPEPVIGAMSRLLKKHPQLTEAQMLLAEAYRQHGDLKPALDIYLAQEQIAPTNTRVRILTGVVYLQMKDQARARAAFEQVLTMEPTNLPALQMLVDLDVSGKNVAAAVQRIQARIQAEPSNVILRLMLAKVQWAQGDSAQAEQTLLKALEIDPKNEYVCQTLAQIYSATGKTTNAIGLLQTVISQNPKDMLALMQLALANESAKDYQNAAATYEKMLAIDPKCSPALNNLAYLYSEYLGQLDRAYELAQQARQLLPSDPSTADTLGWISLKRGAYPVGLELIQECADKLPAQPEVQYHLGMANYLSGNEDAARTAFAKALQLNPQFNGAEECQTCLTLLGIDPQTAGAAAIQTLEQRLAKTPDDPVALARLAKIYQRTGQLDKSIASYEALIKSNSRNVPALNALAGLYEAKDPAKAYAYAKSAFKLDSQNASLGSLYGRLAYVNGDFKLANVILQEAAQKLSGNAVAQFDYARAAYSVGNVAQARDALQQALAAGLPEKSSAEAKRILECIALADNPQPIASATARVAEILAAEPDYVPALMAQVKLNELTAHPDLAAMTCEKALAKYPDFSPAQRELAILYAPDASKSQAAYALAIKARAVYPDDPTLAKAIAIIVFQQGDYARAAALLKDCASSSSSDAEIFYYLGSAQFQLKKMADSKVSLQKALTLKLSGQQANSARQMIESIK